MRRLALLLCGGSGGYLQGIHVHHDYIIKREQPTTVCHLCNAGDFGPSEPFFCPSKLTYYKLIWQKEPSTLNIFT